MQSYFDFIDLPECSSEEILEFNRSLEKVKSGYCEKEAENWRIVDGACHRDEC